jgi:phosphohistidine swiveling domain-containing protein
VVGRRDLQAVSESCRPLFGDRSTFVAHCLAQGSVNDTLSADEALGNVAGAQPGSPDGDRELERYLSAYGSRATSWSIDQPTLRERPDLVHAQLRVLRRSSRDVGAVRAEAVDRRRRLADDIRTRLGDPQQRDRFDRRLSRLESFVPVREARARWQLVAAGALRRAALARGRQLVDRGVLDAAEDVLLLTPEEYDAPSGALRAAVALRRADHQRWAAITPPAEVGATAASAPAPDRTLPGAPGAPGSVSGSARVVLDLVQAERLEPGEVLVTTATSPPWTPLFGIAVAVVTDAGDVLSHVAIAAREYGIPCVVGTHHATRSIRTGDAIIVDGDLGTVRFLG